MPTTAELIGELKSAVADVSQQVADQTKTFNEKVETVEKMVDDIKDQQKEIRRETLGDNAPVADDDPQRVTMTNKGMIDDRFGVLPFEKTLSMSPNHPAIKGTAVAENLALGQDLHDSCAIVYSVCKAMKGENYAEASIKKHPDMLMYSKWLERNGYFKANETIHPGSSGIGEKLNFTLLAAQLLERVRIESDLTDDFVNVTLTRPQQNFPVLTGDALGVLGAGGDTTPPPTGDITSPIPTVAHWSNPTFGQCGFDVKHNLGYIAFNDDMLEDSVVPFMPIMRSQVALAIARSRDRCCFQGDPGGTMDSNRSYAATDFRKAWYGLRFMGVVDHTESSANTAWEHADFRAQRAILGKFGRNPSRLVHYSTVATWLKMLETTEVITIDKFGPQATIKTGVLGKLDGIDLKIHEYVENTLDATGKDTGASGEGDRSVSYMWNRDRFMLGQYMGVDIETTRFAPMLFTMIQADVRQDFEPIDQHIMTSYSYDAGDAPLALVINIAD